MQNKRYLTTLNYREEENFFYAIYISRKALKT